jgi:hypothetical protein
MKKYCGVHGATISMILFFLESLEHKEEKEASFGKIWKNLKAFQNILF